VLSGHSQKVCLLSLVMAGLVEGVRSISYLLFLLSQSGLLGLELSFPLVKQIHLILQPLLSIFYVLLLISMLTFEVVKAGVQL